jgi:hypothetical protein
MTDSAWRELCNFRQRITALLPPVNKSLAGPAGI